tara:strand:- start:19258 stop:19923 length:666 start_codon:yes stop_codon:yes gene_type:complete
MKCKNCNSEIPASQINIATDLAHCKSCNTISKISEISKINDTFDIKKNPKGTWYKRVSTIELNLGASTASPIAFFLIPFMLVWSGGSLGGIYGYQIISGEFNLFMSLFGIPFLIGTFFFGGIALMAVAGKIDIKLTKQGGEIFTGIGSIGFTKKFLWSEISEVKEQSYLGYKRRGSGSKIVLEGSRRISFGSRLKEGRKYYLINALKNVHFNIKNNNTLSF